MGTELEQKYVVDSPRPWAVQTRLLAQLNRQGTAIFMISHDLAGARQYASHVLYLGAQTSFFGTRAEYENWKGENAWA